jgi:hypothetical protein
MYKIAYFLVGLNFFTRTIPIAVRVRITAIVWKIKVKVTASFINLLYN